MSRPETAVPTSFELADLDRRHYAVVTAEHAAPGLCATCLRPPPCDARLALNAMAASRYAGDLMRGFRALDQAWDAYTGTGDEEGSDIIDDMASAIGGLRETMRLISGRKT